jgi:hypothetical protein
LVNCTSSQMRMGSAAPHVGERRVNIGTNELSFSSYRRVSGSRNRPLGYGRPPA